MSVAETWGMRCPKCGSDEDLRVEIRAWADLTEDGTDAGYDHEWDSDSRSSCGCGWSGFVADCYEAASEEGVR